MANPRKHLIYKGTLIASSYGILPRKPNEMPEQENENPNYYYQKENYRQDIINFEQALEDITRLKRQWLDQDIVSQQDLDTYSEYYIVINSFGRILNDFIKEFKLKYTSSEFKYYANFNRQVIINLSISDLRQFLADMVIVANYDITGGAFHPNYGLLKRIKNFSYYSINDRINIDNITDASFLLQFFQIDIAKKNQIIDRLTSDGSQLIELTPSIYKIIPPTEDLGKLKQYVGIYSDIKGIQTSSIDVVIDPEGRTREQSEFHLDRTLEEESLVKVGIIDSGIAEHRSVLEPFIDKVYSKSYVDETPLVDSSDHGTGVSSIVVFGSQINEGETSLIPYAKVVSIKIFGTNSVYFTPELFFEIVNNFYIEKGIRIFNMSINCKYPKKDNENHDLMTYILDYCLAKYPDILFFVSTGNVNDFQDIKARYSGSHNCKFDEGTNICMPADSNNAIAIGSIESTNQISEFSRKNCLDYGSELTTIKRGGRTTITTDIGYRSSFYLKPDFLDLGNDIKMLSSDYDSETIVKGGTSFSSPLVCHIAARLLKDYTFLSANSIKALLMNSSSSRELSLPLNPNDGINIPAKLNARNILYRKGSVGNDTKIQNREISLLEKRYSGFGKININRALYSDSNKVTFVIEDTIKLNYENIYEINLPEDLENSILYGTGSINLIGSLSYNHIPIISDHLNYNPIHMAYRLLACSQEELEILTSQIKQLNIQIRPYDEGSDQFRTANEHRFNTLIEQRESLQNEVDRFVIKVGGKARSQDNFYRIQYGNNQSIGNTTGIKKDTLRGKLSNKLFVEVRCNIKTKDTSTNVFQEIRDFIYSDSGMIVTDIESINNYIEQKFGFCLTIENRNTNGIDIYNSILNANVGILVEADSVIEAENVELNVDQEADAIDL